MSDQERDTGIIISHPNRKVDPDYSKTFNVIGQTGLRRKDGYEKVSGKAVYCMDFNFPGTLYARILSCPHANATIKSMDTSKASALPGVRYILRYDDPNPLAQAMVVPSHGYFEGDPMGAIVVADTDEIAQEGIKLIEVEWNVLPFMLECDDSLKSDAPLVYNPRGFYGPSDPNQNRLTAPTVVPGQHPQEMGDVQQGFAEADQTIEFTASRKENNGRAEPMSASTWWKDNHFEYALYGQTNNNIGFVLKEPGGVPQAAGFQHPCYNGGGFGTSAMLTMWSSFIGPVLSQRLMRPVKLTFGLQQSFYSSASDDCGHETFKVGFKNDGTITAVQSQTKYNGATMETGLSHFEENSSVKNLLCNYDGAFTNRPVLFAYRSEQRIAAQGLNWVCGHVADALGMDPTEVALKNEGAHGEDREYLKQYKIDNGFPDRDSLQECINAAKNGIDFDNTWHTAGAKTLPDGRKHGIGFAWDHEWSDTQFQGSCALLVRVDGTAEIIANHMDCGLNPASSYCQVAAEELGLKYEDVYFKDNCEGHGLQLMHPASASNMNINGWAVKGAAQKVKAQMLETATKGVVQDLYKSFEDPIITPAPTALFPNLNPEDLDIKNGVIFEKNKPDNKHTVIELLGQVRLDRNLSPFLQSPFFAYNFYNAGICGIDMPYRERLTRQAHFCEVAVDTETGEIEVTKVVNVNDVGKAISPETVNGQQYGASIMGISRVRHEEAVLDPSTGVMLNGNILDYKVATMRDCGPIDTRIVETALGYGPYGLVGVAESCSDLMSSAFGPAVQNAIGVWIDDYPITPDKVLKALGKI